MVAATTRHLCTGAAACRNARAGQWWWVPGDETETPGTADGELEELRGFPPRSQKVDGCLEAGCVFLQEPALGATPGAGGRAPSFPDRYAEVDKTAPSARLHELQCGHFHSGFASFRLGPEPVRREQSCDFRQVAELPRVPEHAVPVAMRRRSDPREPQQLADFGSLSLSWRRNFFWADWVGLGSVASTGVGWG